MATVSKIQAIIEELNQEYYERNDAIHAAMLALLSGEHCFMLGKPGTGKSEMIRALASRISARHFSWLLTRFSAPDELFGAIDVAAMKAGQHTRITSGKMPEAEIVFLDEIFKANSAILNALLTITNERLFFNNGTPVQTPLLSLFSASNETPEDDSLSALYDRFLFRVFVDYIKDDANRLALMGRYITGNQSSTSTQITTAELQQAQADVKAINVPQSTLQQFNLLLKELDGKDMPMSDRRMLKCLRAMQANAYIDGRASIDDEDIAVLKYILWRDPAEISEINKLVNRYANSVMAKVQEAGQFARETFNSAKNIIAEMQKSTGSGTAAYFQQLIEHDGKLQSAIDTINDVLNQHPNDRHTKGIKSALARVQKFQEEVRQGLFKSQNASN